MQIVFTLYILYTLSIPSIYGQVLYFNGQPMMIPLEHFGTACSLLSPHQAAASQEPMESTSQRSCFTEIITDALHDFTRESQKSWSVNAQSHLDWRWIGEKGYGLVLDMYQLFLAKEWDMDSVAKPDHPQNGRWIVSFTTLIFQTWPPMSEFLASLKAKPVRWKKSSFYPPVLKMAHL